VGTHGILWNGILAVYSFDHLAFFVLPRTDEVEVRILAFEAVCVSHGGVYRVEGFDSKPVRLCHFERSFPLFRGFLYVQGTAKQYY